MGAFGDAPAFVAGVLSLKLVVNTFCEYQDGADFEAQTQGDQTRVRVPERSTVILLAEHDL